MTSITIDDLEFELRRSNRRRSLQVTVDRNGDLILFAPAQCEPVLMERFVREKRSWIYEKLAQKRLLRQSVASKEYVNGEGFPYLGRSYRLLLVDDQAAPLKLQDGRFKLRRSAVEDGREHLVRWYESHADPWLRARVLLFSDRLGVRPQAVEVRDLAHRWGSCGKGDKLYFHWRSILLPPPIVEYIVVHELVHLSEPHHTLEFWLRVERAMPDYAARKQSLAEDGHRVDAI